MTTAQLTALLFIKEKKGYITIENFDLLFDQKKYGITTVSSLLKSEYIAEDPENKKFCYITSKGERIIEAIYVLTALIP